MIMSLIKNNIERII